MKVVVTGAAGFIGGNLTRELLKDKTVEVIGIDSFTDYYNPEIKRQNVSSLGDRGFTLVEDDLSSMDLTDLLQDVDAVFHQAGQPGVRKSWGSEFETYTRNNIAVTQRLLEAAKSSTTLKSFVYASSSSVYGDAEGFPTHESDLPRPMSPYGVSKLAAEHLVTLYAKNFGVPTTSLRYFTVYGPGQRPDMAFNKFIRAGLRDRKLTIYGDGRQIREFTHVADIVRANIAVLRASPAPGSVINLSGGSSVTVNETLEVLASILQKPLSVEYAAKVAGDVFRTGGSTNRAKELLDWTPTIDIREGLESQVSWMESLPEALFDTHSNHAG